MNATTAPVPRAARARPDLRRYRWAVASRSVAAVGAGYLLSMGVAAGLAVLMPALGMARAEAVLTATMLGFAAHACAVLWAFGCRTALRAWVGILVPAALLGAMPWWVP